MGRIEGWPSMVSWLFTEKLFDEPFMTENDTTSGCRNCYY
jgi:hypothetical protein